MASQRGVGGVGGESGDGGGGGGVGAGGRNGEEGVGRGCGAVRIGTPAAGERRQAGSGSQLRALGDWGVLNSGLQVVGRRSCGRWL